VGEKAGLFIWSPRCVGPLIIDGKTSHESMMIMMIVIIITVISIKTRMAVFVFSHVNLKSFPIGSTGCHGNNNIT
jgi:hypothetical protein